VGMGAAYMSSGILIGLAHLGYAVGPRCGAPQAREQGDDAEQERTLADRQRHRGLVTTKRRVVLSGSRGHVPFLKMQDTRGE
jgi:hypothetical protein